MDHKTTRKPAVSYTDWLIRGVLSRVGDKFDRLTGRRSASASSIATSKLIARLIDLLDNESNEIPGKGFVIPHIIELKIQWDKFETDSDERLARLENELLLAVIDHINDRRYYTYAEVRLKVRPDYFVEGVKLTASFDDRAETSVQAALALPVTSIEPETRTFTFESEPTAGKELIFVYKDDSGEHSTTLHVLEGKRISVGRDSNNRLMLNNSSVSKMHASLVLTPDGQLKIADTGSTNGTFINDEQIPYGKAIRIKMSDRLRFGDVVVSLREPEKLTVDESIPVDIRQNIELSEHASSTDEKVTGGTMKTEASFSTSLSGNDTARGEQPDGPE